MVTGYTAGTQIWYAKYTDSWSVPLRISTYSGMESYNQARPSIAVGSSNSVHVVWYGMATGYTTAEQIWYAKYTDSWAILVRISTYTGMENYAQVYPSIAIDSSNSVHVVWAGRATGYTDYDKVWYGIYTTSWTAPECLQATGQNKYPNARWSWYPSSNIPSTRVDYVFTEGTASLYDIYFGYIPLPVTAYQDIATRFKLTIQAYQDIATRFKLTVQVYYKDITTRFKLWAQGYQDIATRFKLIAQSYQDVAARFGISVQAFSDVTARFRLTAQNYIDTATRFNLWTQTYGDINTRFRLVITAYPIIGGGHIIGGGRIIGGGHIIDIVGET